MKNFNVNTKEQGIELLKEIGSVEFQFRNEVDHQYGNETLKIVGMDLDFNILGYSILEIN
jgi:hypothetical protein